MIASLPSIAMDDFESFRSKRVVTSFRACWMALETSCRSILLTTSKVFSGIGFRLFNQIIPTPQKSHYQAKRSCAFREAKRSAESSVWFACQPLPRTNLAIRRVGGLLRAQMRARFFYRDEGSEPEMGSQFRSACDP